MQLSSFWLSSASPKQTTEGSEQRFSPCSQFLKRITFLTILLLVIGCQLIHGYSTNSLLSVIIASTRLLLTTCLNSWESISQPANFAHLLILPFSVFPLYAHTRLVKGHILMLRRQSGTFSLTKSGHPAPSSPSNHHLKLIFFSSPTDCECGGGGRGKESEGETRRERKKEREN